jgi:hypothetical protein
MLASMRFVYDYCRCNLPLLSVVALLLAACQSQPDQTEAAVTTPPVGHYEGSINAPGQPEMRIAIDIRHPSPGHYEAEFTAPTASTLSFVADTIGFDDNRLHLVRPARPNQVLDLTLDGDFWRGTLALDSAKATTIMVKRGVPTPSTYRVEEVPQANGSAWLFAPADTGTPGAALALLPDASTAPTAAIWADALAREGLIVLLLPTADSATSTAEETRLQAALRFLRGTPGADTASIGTWATGSRAAAVATVLAGDNAPKLAFFIAQNTQVLAESRTAFRALRARKLPILALYGGAAATAAAAPMRNVLGGRRGALVRTYRTAASDLLVPGHWSPDFGPGLPGDVLDWLRAK